jgi:hypothetical protein
MKALLYIFITSSLIGTVYGQDCSIKFNEIRTINDDADNLWNEKEKKYERVNSVLTKYGADFPDTVTIEMDVESDCEKTEKVSILMEIFPLAGDANLAHDAKGFHRNKTQPKYETKTIYTKRIEADIEKGKKTLVMSNIPLTPLFEGLMEKNRWYWKLKYTFVMKNTTGKGLSEVSIERESPLQH